MTYHDPEGFLIDAPAAKPGARESLVLPVAFLLVGILLGMVLGFVITIVSLGDHFQALRSASAEAMKARWSFEAAEERLRAPQPAQKARPPGH